MSRGQNLNFVRRCDQVFAATAQDVGQVILTQLLNDLVQRRKVMLHRQSFGE